jgi:hypothetical protein
VVVGHLAAAALACLAVAFIGARRARGGPGGPGGPGSGRGAAGGMRSPTNRFAGPAAEPLWLARALGLAATVAFMLWTGAVHPPGGALVLIFADSTKVRALPRHS